MRGIVAVALAALLLPTFLGGCFDSPRAPRGPQSTSPENVDEADPGPSTKTSSATQPPTGAPPTTDSSPPTFGFEPERRLPVACARCFEPSMAITANGTIFVTDAGAEFFVFSQDGGITWKDAVKPPRPEGALATESGDAFLTTDLNGDLWWLDLLVGTLADTESRTTQYARLVDGQWTPNVRVDLAPSPVRSADVDDRPWFADLGTAFAAVCNCPGAAAPSITLFDATGQKQQPQVILGAEGRPAPIGPPANGGSGLLFAFSQGAAVLPTGELAVARVGATLQTSTGWVSSEVAGALDGPYPYSPWHNAAYVHGQGYFVPVIHPDRQIVMHHSVDGRSWSSGLTWGDDGVAPAPWLAPLGSKVAATWFAGSSSSLDVVVAIGDKDDVDGSWVVGSGATAATDYPNLAIGKSGQVGVVWTSSEGISYALSSTPLP